MVNAPSEIGLFFWGTTTFKSDQKTTPSTYTTASNAHVSCLPVLRSKACDACFHQHIFLPAHWHRRQLSPESRGSRAPGQHGRPLGAAPRSRTAAPAPAGLDQQPSGPAAPRALHVGSEQRQRVDRQRSSWPPPGHAHWLRPGGACRSVPRPWEQVRPVKWPFLCCS